MAGPNNARYEVLQGIAGTIFAFGRGLFGKVVSSTDGVIEALSSTGVSNPTNTPVQNQNELAVVRAKDPRAGQVGANDLVTRRVFDTVQSVAQSGISYLEIAVGNAANTYDSTTAMLAGGRVVRTEVNFTGSAPYSANTTITVGQPTATDAFMDATQNYPQGPVGHIDSAGGRTTTLAAVARVTVAGPGGPAGAAAVVGIWYVPAPLG